MKLERHKVEAQICLQCGSMSWLMVSNSYVGEYRVRKDGHVEFNELSTSLSTSAANAAAALRR